MIASAPSLTVLRRALVILVLLSTESLTQTPVNISALQTRAESTEFRETSRYDDVLAFLREVDRASPKIHLTTFGYSWEGRALPLAVWGDVADATPEAVLRTGKIRVLIQANIHAGEVEGKEATLMLLRSLASGQHSEWSKSLVILVLPLFNADGKAPTLQCDLPAHQVQ